VALQQAAAAIRLNDRRLRYQLPDPSHSDAGVILPARGA
jgi:hypothetical protein